MFRDILFFVGCGFVAVGSILAVVHLWARLVQWRFFQKLLFNKRPWRVVIFDRLTNLEASLDSILSALHRSSVTVLINGQHRPLVGAVKTETLFSFVEGLSVELFPGEKKTVTFHVQRPIAAGFTIFLVGDSRARIVDVRVGRESLAFVNDSSVPFIQSPIACDVGQYITVMVRR